MIGKSYDGTLSNGVAATGVDGLTTIVPISAISRWYDYSRSNGIRHNNNYPGNSLANTVTNADRRTLCAPTRTTMNDIDGDEHGDINPFWHERDHLKDADKVKASVFLTHGLQDDNVRFDQGSRWWDALEANNVPRKMWITRTGHEDPFDFRRTEWVTTIHRWFDFWLQGVPNGIMDEPKVDIEVAANAFVTASDWPLPGRRRRACSCAAPRRAAPATSRSPRRRHRHAVVDRPGQPEREHDDEQPARLADEPARVPLAQAQDGPAHLRHAVIDIEAAVNRTQTNLGALLVEYGPTTQVSRTSDGIANAPPRRRRRSRRRPATASRARTTAPATSRSSRSPPTPPSGASRRASWTPRTASRCSRTPRA